VNPRLIGRALTGVAALAALVALPPAAAVPPPDKTLAPGTRFHAPGPSAGAIAQVADLLGQGRTHDARLVGALAAQPHAVWLTQGSPAEVRAQVRKTLQQAARQNAVPVLVAYNIPGRDCSGYSGGGANTTAAYKAWIDAVASGIGSAKAIVLVEPDGNALQPRDCGGTPEQQAARIEELNYAVDRLGERPRTLVYVDAGHSHWHSVGGIARRLVEGGLKRAQGFFLNPSNYRATPNELKFGTWISKCLYYVSNPATPWTAGQYDWCASQYFPANADDFSTWGLTDAWYAANVDTAPNPPSGPSALAHFVVDTSRNGQGPWAGALDWCNPPGRGAGARPTTVTGSPLADAYIWIKVPGESDGQCNRDGNPAGIDTEWGIVDPAAGQWFPQQALQLAQLAQPPLF
jgi:endoglucanase